MFPLGLSRGPSENAPRKICPQKRPCGHISKSCPPPLYPPQRDDGDGDDDDANDDDIDDENNDDDGGETNNMISSKARPKAFFEDVSSETHTLSKGVEKPMICSKILPLRPA